MNTRLIFLWAVILGVVGFVCGFVGPIVLAPDANQGPLLGIFITGPAGVALGAILGLVVGTVNPAPATASRILCTVAAAGAVITLYFCIPSPHHHADVIDAEIRQCTPPERLRDETVDRLNALAARYRPPPNPVAWGEAFDQALRKERGVVIEVHVFRDSRLYRLDAPWNRGTFEARPWSAAGKTRTYFAAYAGGDCGSYPLGNRSLYKVTGHTQIWPPAYIAEMLALQAAVPLASADAGLLRNVGGRLKVCRVGNRT
jgi:hypothetical protein